MIKTNSSVSSLPSEGGDKMFSYAMVLGVSDYVASKAYSLFRDPPNHLPDGAPVG